MWSWIHQLVADQSLRSKMMLATVVCIVVPVCTTLIIYTFQTREAVKEQAVANAERELQLTEAYVSKLLEDMLYIANFVQMDSEINTILKGKENTRNSPQQTEDTYEAFIDDSKVRKTMDNITLVGEKSYVTILLTSGQAYANYSTSEYDPVTMFQERWFHQLRDVYGFESYWIGSHPTVFKSEKKGNPYQISVARTLRDGSSNIYGYVVVSLDENQFSKIFENVAANEEMMLVDASHQIISHKDDDRIGETLSYLKGRPRNEASTIVRISDEDYLVSRRSIPFVDWQLVSLTPYKQAVYDIHSIFHKVFMAELVLFVAFLFILAYFLRVIVQPIVHLGSVADAVQQGDLTVRSRIKGKDEIGRLAESFDLMLDRINAMIRDITETQERKRKAELAMLQAQINPHFLFNALNSIRMKVMRKGDIESSEMISSLSKLLRMTIDQGRETIPFRKEIDIAKDYIHLMNMRRSTEVQLDIHVSTDAYLEEIPRFILQPIIENSIIHGFSQDGGTISLDAYVEEDVFVIQIEDNGRGMSRKKLEHVQESLIADTATAEGDGERKGFSNIGLSNVFERMRMTFGTAFRMRLESKEGQGTKVIMFIPRR